MSLSVQISRQAQKFLGKLPPKPKRQIATKIQSLTTNPFPQDSKPLKGFAPLHRVDAGEYRIVYRLEEEKLLLIALIGKRNDDHVYRLLKRQY